MAALLALLAAVGWGSSDYAAGRASRRSSAVSVVILTHFTAVIVLLAFAVDLGPVWTWFVDLVGDPDADASFRAPRIAGRPTAVDMAWGLAAGLGGGLGAMLLFRGLGRGRMSVVAPVTAAGAAIVPVVYGLATGDPLTIPGLAGIGLALVAIVLVSLTDAGADPDTITGGAEPVADDPGADPVEQLDGWLHELGIEPPAPPPTNGHHVAVDADHGWATAARVAVLTADVRIADVAFAPAPVANGRSSNGTAATTLAPPPTGARPVAPVGTRDAPDLANADLGAGQLRRLRRVVQLLLGALVVAAVGIAARPVTALAVSGRATAIELAMLGFAVLTAVVAMAILAVLQPLLPVAPAPVDGSGSVAWRRLLRQPGLPEALVSGIGFGAFFVCIYRAAESAGQWPLIGARGISVAMFVVAALVSRTSVLPARDGRRGVLVAGVLDAAAAVLFVLATRAGLLSVGAVLASLYPAVTVLLARTIDHEPVGRRQVLGLGLAFVAVGLLAA